MKLKQVKPRRRIYKKDEVKRIHIYVPIEYLEDFAEFKKELRKFSGQKITLAFLFREGGRNLMKSLRVQMAKAQKGVLHAKPRKDILS
jgi:hypothetical protein